MQKISRFVALVLGLVSPVLAATASAQPLPCQVTIAAPANNSTVSGTVAVSIDNSCTGNLSVFDRVYVFNTGTFQFSSSPYFWDTTSIPNGTYTIVAIAWDPTGLIEEGISADVSLTIANGAAATQPTPTPAKPTPTPAPTSSPGGLLPYGNIAPPAGTSWSLIYDDEFTNDTAVNSSLWNGADAGGVPMCYPSGANSSLCQSVYVSETIWDCLGYSGEQSCANSYGGTLPDGASYGESIQTGVGLLVQPAPAPYTDPDPTYGAGQYEDNAWAGLNNYGKLSPVIYGYFEWKAKLPTDVSGEGDGIHTDLWCTTNDRNSEGNASQVDVNEWIGGTSNHDYQLEHLSGPT
jgi:hypothetical protein